MIDKLCINGFYKNRKANQSFKGFMEMGHQKIWGGVGNAPWKKQIMILRIHQVMDLQNMCFVVFVL